MAGANCQGKSLVTVVGHMDDDLFFVDPGISTAARQGACVTTVFVIGGSSGAGFDYVPVRETASKAAYARMFGVASNWTTDTISVGDNKLMRVSLVGKPNVSLVFMRVPGGNVRGGDVPLANVFDNASMSLTSWSYTAQQSGATNTYTRANLIATVKGLIEGFGATQVFALNPDTLPYIEHPDHIYSARLTREALRQVGQNLPVSYHETYPTAGRVANVSPTETQIKRDLLGAYMQNEGFDYQAAGIFGEYMYNGNWIARNYSRSAMAWDNTPTIDTPWAPIVNMHTQHCLNSAGVNQAVSVSGCVAGASHQQWRYIPSTVSAGNWGTALIQNSNGNCLALRDGVATEEFCNSADAAQKWQPWDFGKLFTNDGVCMVQSGYRLSAGNCANGYPETALWAREITTVDSDMNSEVALVGDVSGAGTDKIVQIYRRNDGPGIDVWVSNLSAGSSTLSSAKWYEGAVQFDPYATGPTCQGNALCFDQSRFLLADFNGDGKADLMVISTRQDGTAFWVLTSTGSGFSAPVLWAQTSSTYAYDLAHQYLAGDFDGDGKPDVMIAHTRGDSGLNFWVLSNTGSAKLAAPALWAEATGLQNNARLFSARVDGSGRHGVIAVDALGGLRISSFLSTGSAFAAVNDARVASNFDATRSKVTVTQRSATALADVWVMHARSDGTAINAWQFNNTGSGSFNAPVNRQTITALAWSNVRPYFLSRSAGNQLLLVHRVDGNVGEYDWRLGNMKVVGLPLNNTGLGSTFTNYGSSSQFQWTDLAWRARLNR